jgi:hypothetical protein
MTGRFFRRMPTPSSQAAYYVTFRMLTGVERLQANADTELARLIGDLRLAGATDITVVDAAGRLVSFDPGVG